MSRLWNGNSKCGSASFLTRDGYITVMLLDDIEHNSQSQPCALFLGSIKWFKYLFELLPGHSPAGIRYLDPDRSVPFLSLYGQGPVPGHCVNGIDKKIDKDL